MNVSFSLPAAAVASIATVAQVAPQPGRDTPSSITCVKLTVDNDQWRAIGTNRVVAVEVGASFDGRPWMPAELILAASDWTEIAKQHAPKPKQDEDVRFELRENGVTVRSGARESRYQLPGLPQGFPPLERLLLKPGASSAGAHKLGEIGRVALDFAQLALAAKVTVPSQLMLSPGKRDVRLNMQFSETETAPVHLTRRALEPGESYRAAVMPLRGDR